MDSLPPQFEFGRGDGRPRDRPWHQFTLRGLFVFVTLAAVVMAGVHWLKVAERRHNQAQCSNNIWDCSVVWGIAWDCVRMPRIHSASYSFAIEYCEPNESILCNRAERTTLSKCVRAFSVSGQAKAVA